MMNTASFSAGRSSCVRRAIKTKNTKTELGCARHGCDGTVTSCGRPTSSEAAAHRRFDVPRTGSKSSKLTTVALMSFFLSSFFSSSANHWAVPGETHKVVVQVLQKGQMKKNFAGPPAHRAVPVWEP